MPTKTNFPFSFARILLAWNRKKNKRVMPWKGEKDPYRIWLSEIILQQTRVEQGWKYYEHFLEQYPNIHILAKASDEKIFKSWEGLGYYNRCRNLIATAREISINQNGIFPQAYENILALKGIGEYTASAIASFAFNQPHAAVDGNVFRLLSRVFGIRKPIDSTEGKKFFSTLALELLDKKSPGIYNQAIMDFGAVICKPQPLCMECPLRKHCIAFKLGIIKELPVKKKKDPAKKREFVFFVMKYRKEIAVLQRVENDIWKGLYSFPFLETSQTAGTSSALKKAEKLGWLQKNGYLFEEDPAIYKQQLTHQHITANFIRIELKTKMAGLPSLHWVSPNLLNGYAYPKLIRDYLAGVDFY
jgi:A/G-specific adenine glycosylase